MIVTKNARWREASASAICTSALSRHPESRGPSLPLRPPPAIVGPRPQPKERVGMARRRSVAYAVEGKSRRPGIQLDWVYRAAPLPPPARDRPAPRAFGHAAVSQGGVSTRASTTPSATHSRCIPSRPGTTSASSRSGWATATSAHHDLHGRPKPQARHRPEHGSPTFGP